jgi:hypothetical protein
MGEENNSGVTAGAPPAPEASPASGPADTGGQGATTGGGQPSTGVDPAQGAPAAAVAGDESGADAGAEEFQSPITEEELAQAPEQWREKFTSLLNGYKSLDADHKTLKGQYQPLSEYGDAETIKGQLELLDGLYGYAQDADGNILYNEQTGLPEVSTTAFVSRIQEGSPALAKQLFLDLWGARGVDGLTGAQRMFQTLGLDPKRLAEYRALTSNPAKSVAPSGVTTPDELAIIPEHHHATYKLLSSSDRYKAQQIEDPDELEDFLNEKQELFESRRFREEYQKAQTEHAARAEYEFRAGVERSYTEYATKLRQDGLNSIVKNLSSQVQFSADPATNAVQTGAVMAIMANLLNPDLHFATQGALQALGVTLDQGFFDSLAALGDQARAVKWYEAVAGNPAMAQHRNDSALAKARGDVDRLYKGTLAKLSGVALKVAKVLAGGNQELREVEKSKLEPSARPTVGGGALPGSGAVKPTAKPFTVEWLQQSQQQRAGQ